MLAIVFWAQRICTKAMQGIPYTSLYSQNGAVKTWKWILLIPKNLYYGNAGDSLYSHNGLPFSTFDVDNDNRAGDFAERSCARLYKVITDVT